MLQTGVVNRARPVAAFFTSGARLQGASTSCDRMMAVGPDLERWNA
jgi:hypothetical protein